MLKNILSLLLSKFYSKQESEAVGHQAMPSTQNVALTPTTTSIDGWGAVYNGVAPTDGFACIRFTADTATCIASAQTQNVNVFTTPQVVGDILLCACPIAKGQVFTLCARQAKNIECWFTKTIGGGYQALKNALLQGGAICLSNLCSSLRRSSCRVKRRLFKTGRIQILETVLRSQFLREQPRLNTHLQVTDVFKSLLETAPQLGPILLNLRLPIHLQLLGCTSTICKVGIATFIRFRKAGRLFLPSRNLIQAVGLLSSRSTNPAVGGASC